MAKAVNDVITDVSRLLQDVTNRRWPTATLIRWASAAQRAIVRLDPTANIVVSALTLQPGVEQSVPTDCVRMVTFLANADGSPVRECTERSLEAFFPNWRAASPSPTVAHVMRVQGDDDTFLVYPPQPSSGVGTISTRYVRLPADLVSGGMVGLPDKFFDSVVHYAAYLALIEDSADVANASRATQFLSAFATMVGVTPEAAAQASNA